MKRLQKLMSFVLVLSLLFTSLVFTTSAAEEDEYYVDENAELFTPSAHYTKITETNVENVFNSLKSAGSENDSFTANALYGGSNLNAYVVTAEDMESYVMIVPTKTAVQNGKVADHVQINSFVNETLSYTAGTSGYYVFEFDLATESSILPLFYQPVIRDASGSGINAWGDSWLPHATENSLYMTMRPGHFHHMTFVCDIDNNTMYVYMDNQLAATHTNAVTSAAMLNAYKNNGAKMNLEGFRIQINSGVTLSGEESYCIKDMHERVLIGEESQNLASYVGKPTLQGWEGNRYEGHTDNKLPPIISVNGVEYNNTVEASNALNSYKEGNEAELMRSVYSGSITVDCDALIHTYSVEVSLKNGPHTEIRKIDGSTWKSDVVKTKYSTEMVSKNPTANLVNSLKYNLEGNIISDIKLQAYGTKDTADAYIMRSYLGNEYIYVTDQNDNPFPDGPHLYLNASVPKTYDYVIAGHDFIVYDFDIYSESELIEVYNNFIPRYIGNNSEKPLSSQTFFFSTTATGNYDIKMDSGEWAHITFIGNVANGDAYVYVNNKLVKTLKRGLYAPGATPGTALDGDGNEYPLTDVVINQFRCLQLHTSQKSGTGLTMDMSLCMDNFDARFVDGDPTLTAGMESLDSWITNLYGNGYQFPELPAIAAVDGVEYYDIYSLTDALTPDYPSTEHKNVVLLREFRDQFTVNCNATIDTRGFHSSVTIGSTCTATTNGDIITVTCPLAETITVEKFANNKWTDSNLYASSVSNNRFSYGSTGNNTDSPFIDINKAFAYGSTDPYINVVCNTDTSYKGSSNNLFLNISTGYSAPFTVIGDDAVGYYVIDFDIAAVDTMLPGFDVSVVMRRQSDTSGYPFSDEIFIGDFVTTGNYWNHVTIVGDIASNTLKVYVNGVYVSDAGKAVRTESDYNSNRLRDDTQVVAEGFRIEFTRNNIQTDMNAGDNVSFDNFAHRLFVNDNYSELASAIESGNISAWSGYTSGKGGDIYAPVAIVDNVPYGDQTSLELALTGEKEAKVEIISGRLTALNVNCNATINTNGFPVNITTGQDFTVKTSGNTVTVSGHFIENMQSTVTTSSSAIYNAIRYDAEDNIFSPDSWTLASNVSGGWGSTGARQSHIFSDLDNGNTFYKESANGKMTGTNDYLNMRINSTKLTYTEGYNEYLVVDFDYAYEGTMDNVTMQFIPRGGVDSFATSAQLKLIGGITEGKFAHVTAVYDYTNNRTYFFVNGEMVKYNGVDYVNNGAISVKEVTTNGTTTTAYKQYKESGKALTVSELRIGSNSNSTFYLDNVYVRYQRSHNTQDNTLATAIENKTLRAWTDNIYNSHYQMTDWPSIATINGVNFSYHEDIQNVLDKADNVEMEYNRAHSDSFTYSSPATVKTNGLTVNYAVDHGYQASMNNADHVLTVSKLGKESQFKVIVNGEEMISETLPYGTDIQELLKEYGFGAGSKVIACNGSIYTGVTWQASVSTYTDPIEGGKKNYLSSGVPTGKLYSDLTLTATGGTKSTDPYVLLDTDGKIVSGTDIMSYFLNKNGTIILGSDWSITSVTNQIKTTSGEMNVCLNGYSIVDNTAAGHLFRCDVASTASFNFYGNGAIDVDQKSDGNAFMYFAYDYTGTIRFKNLDIDSSLTLLSLRSGNAEVIGCDIDAYLTNSNKNGLFYLCEDYNAGYSKNPVNLTITSSSIDFRYYEGGGEYETAVIVHRVVSTGYAADPKVTVIINNSDIVSQSALVEAYRGHTGGGVPDDNDAAEKSNMTVYLNKVSLVANSLANGEIKGGSIVFYEDVRTNITNTECVSYIKKLSQAKTSDGMTPYLYSSYDYGTVTWSNGNVELWATGSLPTHEICKYDNAVTVERGETYEYESTSSSAPFKFLVNLTLSNEISFNFYVPVAYANTKVYIDGKIVEAGPEVTYVGSAASDCYNYTISFAPHEAAKEFTVSMVLSSGITMTRKISIGLYAESLMKQINANPTSPSSVKNKELLGAALGYIKAASAYSGVTTDLTTVNKILVSCAVSTIIPSGTDYSDSISALGNYFTGVQINADTSSKFRFNVKAGADISSLTFSVDGRVRSHAVAADGSYVELDLRAYEMTHDITISVGGSSATYNLYTYYAGLYAISQGEVNATQKDAISALSFIHALYTYADIADRHLDARD